MNKIFILVFLISSVLNIYAQDSKAFNGLLLDIHGNPIKNARVYIKNKHAYASTTKEGKFGLLDVNGEDTLHIKINKNIYHVPVEGRRSIVIRMVDQTNYQAVEDQRLIDIGYGYVTRREHTNATEAYISGDELMRTGQSNILAALSGRVPGVNIYYEQGEWIAEVRGNRTLKGTTAPLYIIDGVISQSLDAVSISQIDYIEIMKDAAIYGSAGANGVIFVHTKK